MAQFGAITAPIYLLFGGSKRRDVRQAPHTLLDDEFFTRFNLEKVGIKDHKDKD